MAKGSGEEQLAALSVAVDLLEKDFGSWQVKWGKIKRFQRLDGAIQLRSDDARPGTPVPFTSSRWGSHAAFGAECGDGDKRLYGNIGNSFIAVVEFGPG
jgi:acyl-homoserine-lactone acylase